LQKPLYRELLVDNFDNLKELSDEEIKSELQSFRRGVMDDLLSGDFDWMMRK